MKVLSYMNSLTAALAFSMIINSKYVCMDVVDEQRIELQDYV